MSSLAGKHILLAVTGSIAAYKAAELTRALIAAGCTVQVALSATARRFIGAPTFQALSGVPPIVDMFAGDDNPDGMDHIAAVRRADIMLIAPATATTIARLAGGFADDLVAALASAADCPLLIAPAMNKQMWTNPSTRRNVEILREFGHHFVGPEEGDLACGEHGTGRLADLDDILAQLPICLSDTNTSLRGRTVVVSAGATIEPIDAMRVITNRSSGRMGFALATAARNAGANVRLIAGSTRVPPPPGMAVTEIVSDTKQMFAAAKRHTIGADIFFAVAAVADFKPSKVSAGKLPRSVGEFKLELVPNTTDIVASIAKRKQAPYCVAFAAEHATGRKAIVAALSKMRAKKVPAIIASPLAANVDLNTCALTFLTEREQINLGKLPKTIAADKIIELVAQRLPDLS